MIDPLGDGAVLAAISLLRDLGFSSNEIRSRIDRWIAAKGFSDHWRDLPNATQVELAKAMQKFFEDNFVEF